MLGATALCYLTASRLTSRSTGVLAAALFATLGVTLRLGAFATYDAMALLLLAAASYAAVRAGEGATASGWLAMAATTLALANATKYATAIFDPIVVGLLLVMALRDRPWSAAVGRAATAALYLVCLLGLLLTLGGGEYVQGIGQTTVARRSGGDPTMAPIAQSWHLIGLLVVVAGVGVIICLARRALPAEVGLLALLAVAALVVPVEQARIHTLTSLDKHVAFGAFFAAVPAGYAIQQLLATVRRLGGTLAAGTLAAGACVLPLHLGLVQSQALFHSWPSSTRLVAAASAALDHRSGPILAEHPQVLSYYLPEGATWYRWSSTFTIRLHHGRSESAGVGTHVRPERYVALIRRGYFSAVELDFGPTAAMDQRLEAALSANPHYQLASHVAYGPRGAEIWTYEPAGHRSNALLRPKRPVEPFLWGVLDPIARPSGVLGPIVATVEVTGVLSLVAALVIRFGWRRRKAIAER